MSIDLELGKWGKLNGQDPQSLAIAFEFVTSWAGEENTSTVCRLCAGAIGIYLEGYKRLPKYRPMKESPAEYGYRCLEKMLAAGVLPKYIYQEGGKALTQMTTLIPTDEEVTETENFTASDQVGG